MTRIRNGRGIPGTALFVLALGLTIWSGYYAAGQLVPGWRGDAATGSAGGSVPDRRAAAGDYDLSSIVDAELFGSTAQTIEPQTAPTPETKLQINLMGLVASADERIARAIIHVGGAGAKPYGIGQSVEGTDATLHAVESQRILLQRGGSIESLALKRESLGSSQSGDASDGSPPVAAPERSAAENGIGEGSPDQFDASRMKLPF